MKTNRISLQTLKWYWICFKTNKPLRVKQHILFLWNFQIIYLPLTFWKVRNISRCRQKLDTFLLLNCRAVNLCWKMKSKWGCSDIGLKIVKFNLKQRVWWVVLWVCSRRCPRQYLHCRKQILRQENKFKYKLIAWMKLVKKRSNLLNSNF